jgi:hypothetical protein
MYGVLLVGGLICILIGIVAGIDAAWKAREKRDGKG